MKHIFLKLLQEKSNNFLYIYGQRRNVWFFRVFGKIHFFSSWNNLRYLLYFDCAHVKPSCSIWNFSTHSLHQNLYYVISIIISLKFINKISAIYIFECRHKLVVLLNFFVFFDEFSYLYDTSWLKICWLKIRSGEV